jgi:hypothetical protein
LEQLEDKEEHTEHVKAKKIATVIMALCKAARKYGGEDKAFIDCAAEQMSFIDVEPKIDTNVFPDFVKVAAKRYCMEKSSGRDFWRQLAPQFLGDDTLTLAEVPVESGGVREFRC